jgi:hypothetical protein
MNKLININNHNLKFSIATNFNMILPPGLKYQRDQVKEIKMIKNSFNTFMFSLDHFLSPEECRQWISYSDHEGFGQVNLKATKTTAHRDVGEIVRDLPEVSANIFNKLLPYLPPILDGKKPVGCADNLRLYQYTVDQRFGRHIDVSDKDPKGRGFSKYTVLIYLNTSMLDKGEDKGIMHVKHLYTHIYQYIHTLFILAYIRTNKHTRTYTHIFIYIHLSSDDKGNKDETNTKDLLLKGGETAFFREATAKEKKVSTYIYIWKYVCTYVYMYL